MSMLSMRNDAFDGTLTVATHFIEIGIAPALVQSIQVVGDTTIVCSAITLQTSNFSKEEDPPPVQGDTPHGASTTTARVAGRWFDEPTTAFPALTLNAAAKQVDMAHMSNFGSRRCALKVVCATGGKLRVLINGKD